MKLSPDLTHGWRIRTGVTVLVIPILLLFVPLDKLTRLLGKHARSVPSAPPDRRVAEWVDGVLERLPWPWRHTCLRRSAVLYHVLRRSGRPVDLVVGVRRNAENELAAHAWLVLDGAPYLEYGTELEEHFTVIAKFPELVAPR